MLALGLVETRGLLAAIEGADAMLKAADRASAGKEPGDGRPGDHHHRRRSLRRTGIRGCRQSLYPAHCRS